MKTGAIGSGEGKQHVDLYRKFLLRKRLLRWASDGAAYVPFIGEGDLAVQLYTDRSIYGADLDAEHAAVAESRLPGAEVRVADCDGWPFPDASEPFAVADFDSYSDPYTGFRAMWEEKAPVTDRLVVFFTDGCRQGMMRTGSWMQPTGRRIRMPRDATHQKRLIYNAYLTRHIWPWFEEYIEPWHVLDRFRYQRGMMIYWGAAIQR